MGNNLYKQRHREKGLCANCSEKALPGRLLCYTHYQNHKLWKEDPTKHSIRNKKIRQQWKKNNQCSKCGAPLDEEGYKQCMNCRMHIHIPRWAYWHELRVRGINYN